MNCTHLVESRLDGSVTALVCMFDLYYSVPSPDGSENHCKQANMKTLHPISAHHASATQFDTANVCRFVFLTDLQPTAAATVA